MANIIIGKSETFEEVKEFPFGYYVWAIGRQNFPYEKCVPLCKEGNIKFSVDTKTLKYIKVESEKLALKLLDVAILKGCDRSKFYEIVNQETKN